MYSELNVEYNLIKSFHKAVPQGTIIEVWDYVPVYWTQRCVNALKVGRTFCRKNEDMFDWQLQM